MAIFVIILTIFAFLSVVCVKNTLNILKNDAGYVVVLDAGHGAPDGGVVGTNTGVLVSTGITNQTKILIIISPIQEGIKRKFVFSLPTSPSGSYYNS